MRFSAALALSVSLAGILGAASSTTAYANASNYASASNENASESKARAFADVRALDHHVLRLALDAVSCARDAGRIGPDGARLLTVIDYSRASTLPRLWVLDLARERLLFEELVAHGQGSGDNFPTRFSNREGSHQTSIGCSAPPTPMSGPTATRCGSMGSNPASTIARVSGRS